MKKHLSPAPFAVPVIDTFPFTEIFLDLDGVFADFDARFKLLTGKTPSQVEKKFMWKTINNDLEFFYRLEMMKDAEHLWAYVRQYPNVHFLTGLPSKQGGKQQKERWVAEKFVDHKGLTHVVPKKQKQDYSGPNKVLIDDLEPNITQWVLKGGHGLLHKNVWDTIAEMEALRKAYG